MAPLPTGYPLLPTADAALAVYPFTDGKINVLPLILPDIQLLAAEPP